MTYVANASGRVNNELKQKEILEFNSQFEGYANKKPGYLNIDNAISIKEFASLCNLVREWNNNNPSDQVEINTKTRDGINLEKYTKSGSKEELETLITELNKGLTYNDKLKVYYFTFKAENITYSNQTGRIKGIYLELNFEIKETQE